MRPSLKPWGRLHRRTWWDGSRIAAATNLGINTHELRCEEDARRLCEERVRLLIIHSNDDEAVPFEHAERIRKACPEAAFWKLEGYRHVGAYAHPRYRERLLNFLRRLEANEPT